MTDYDTVNQGFLDREFPLWVLHAVLGAIVAIVFMIGILIGWLSSDNPRMGTAAAYWYGFGFGVLCYTVLRIGLPWFWKRI